MWSLMENLSLRIARSVLPQGLPLHLVLQAESSQLAVQIIPAGRSAKDTNASMEIESFPLPADQYASVLRLDTAQMEAGEYLAVISTSNGRIQWEESFWVLDHDAYQN